MRSGAQKGSVNVQMTAFSEVFTTCPAQCYTRIVQSCPSLPVSRVLAAAMVDSRLLTPSLPAPFTTTDTIERLTQIVSGYLLTTAPNDKFKCGGREVLSAQLRWHVKQNMPLEL